MREAFQATLPREDLQLQVLELDARGEALPTVLEELVRLAEMATGMRGSILLCIDGKLRHGATPSLPEAYSQAIDGIAIGPGVGSCGTAAFLGHRVIVEDVTTHPFWPAFRDLALGFGLVACWSQPVMSAGGEVLGTFALYACAPKAPEPKHLRLLESASRLACIAIERERADAKGGHDATA